MKDLLWVFVDEVYEGTYDVHTSLGEAIVDRTTDGVDPLGLGRVRSFIDDRTSSSRRYGWVGWGERPDNSPFTEQGHIEVASSLNNAVLQLTLTASAALGLGVGATTVQAFDMVFKRWCCREGV